MNSFSEKAKQTIQRHKLMSCKTFEVKIDKSQLSEEKLEYLNRIFLEAKWFQNYIISSNDIFSFDNKINKVFILNKDKGLEEREIICLSSQMKESVREKLENAVKSLSIKKKKNLTLPLKRRKRIGKIKYTSNVKALVLRQFYTTYRFKNNKYLVLQGSRFKTQVQN